MRFTSSTVVSISSARRPRSRTGVASAPARSSWRMAVCSPSEMPVSCGPRPSCRSRRIRRRSSSRAEQHGQARASQVGGEADPAHGQRERCGQLLQGGLVTRSQGGGVGPAHQQPADHLVVVAQEQLPPVAGVHPGRRVGSVRGRPLPAVRSGDVDGHGVQPHLPAQAGGERREQVLLLVDGAHVAHHLADEGEGLVTGAVDEVVDEAPHPLPARLDQERDRAGGGHQEPRRPAPPTRRPRPATSPV